MTAIKKLIDGSGNQYFPQTHTKAVVDDNGNTVESRLGAMQDEINQAQLAVGAVPSDLAPTEDSTNWVTSGGVYNAIQGVQSELTELAGELESTAFSEDEIDLSTKIAAGNYGFWDGIWRSDSTHSGWFIPISGESIRVVAGNGLVCCMFCSGTTQTAGTASSYVSGPFLIKSGDTWTYDIPENATYLWCNINAYDKRVLPSAVTIISTYSVSRLDRIENKVEALEEGSTALSEDEIDLSTKIAAGNYGFWGGIWRSDPAHSGWFIPISGESIRVVAGNGLVCCMFCSGTTQTAGTASSYVSGPFLIKSGDTWTYDIPENATYLWCNINAYDKRVLPSAVYCTQRFYDLNSYSQKIEPKISSLSSKVGTIEDIGDTIGDNDSLVRTFKGIVFYNKDDNELYIRSLTTGTWIYKDVECLRNPIIEDNSADASIIVVDGTYYAFATYDLNFRSTDLVHWEKLSEKTIPASYTSSRWAPDVNYLSNKYVIYLTYNGNSLLVLSSDTILNEDRYTVEAELNLGSIDYCYYNGYLFYGSGTVYRRTMTDYKTPADDAVTLSGPSGEGPMLWHYGDYYYMFTSTPLSADYRYDVKVYRASSLTATTWENGGKILGSTSSSEILNGPGHVSEVLQDADGRYFMMMQIHIYNSGWTYRPTIIQEFRMNANGWPEFIDATGNVITKPSIMCRKPKLPLTVLK